MTKWILAADIAKYVGKEVILKGWAFNKRSSGKIAFIQLRDGTGLIQVVIEKKSIPAESWDLVDQITLESSIICTGTVSKHPKKEEYELQCSSLEVVNIAGEYPIGKKEHGPGFLLDHRHLWLRSGRQWAIQRIRNTVINATYEWMAKHHFINIDSPILTPAAC